jgi:hypothetical protein
MQMPMRRFTKSASAILLALLAAAGLLHAQAHRSIILGQVTDPTGAAIGNAEVRVIQGSTGVVRSTRTNAGGHYEVTARAHRQVRGLPARLESAARGGAERNPAGADSRKAALYAVGQTALPLELSERQLAAGNQHGVAGRDRGR